MKRATCLLAAAAAFLCASPALADGLDDARSDLDSVYKDIGAQDEYWFEFTGTSVRAGKTHSQDGGISVRFEDFVVDGQTVTKAYLEMAVMEDGGLVRRVVADGTDLWDYDAAANTFRVYRYGDSTTPGRYAERLGNALKSRSAGPLALLTHFVARALEYKAYGSAHNEWTPFDSNSEVSVDPTGVVCVGKDASPVTVSYELDRSPNAPPTMSSLSYSWSQTWNGQNETQVWTARFNPNTSWSLATYTFDRGNARSESVTLRQGGS